MAEARKIARTQADADIRKAKREKELKRIGLCLTCGKQLEYALVSTKSEKPHTLRICTNAICKAIHSKRDPLRLIV